jgi:hypothetical protein
MYDYAGHKWGHRNSTKEIKRNLDAISEKKNIQQLHYKTHLPFTAHNTESTAV